MTSRDAVSRITIAWLIDAIMLLKRSRSGPSVATTLGANGANGVR